DVVEDVQEFVRDGADQVGEDAEGSMLLEFVTGGAFLFAAALGIEAQSKVDTQFLKDRRRRRFFLGREVGGEDDRGGAELDVAEAEPADVDCCGEPGLRRSRQRWGDRLRRAVEPATDGLVKGGCPARPFLALVVQRPGDLCLTASESTVAEAG